MARIAASPGERHSWEANAAKVSNLLRVADVPDGIHVVFECEGWVPASGFGHLNRNMFVIRAVGQSMEPQIPNGFLCVFRANPAGSRQGKTVLVQHRDVSDPDTGGAFSIKRYESRKCSDSNGSWIHEEILLHPVNAFYSPICIHAEDVDSFRIVAEFVGLPAQ